ncbi:interleukin-18 [Microcaecilia unicolor]|uniref:Interleukin-18-like n=1 Tax=Microcaecilia unicolor TaxID=1415580 RepID=A0A6P7ZVM0_9AMPH|nr:interleukin-18-like [Microcaecilia unicolor]
MEAQAQPDQPASSYTLTTSDLNVLFIKEQEEILYFQELQADSWKMYDNQPLQALIENRLNDTLVAYPDEPESYAVFRAQTVQEKHKDKCKVKIHEYMDTSPREGLSIAITVQKDSKTYIMYCRKDTTLGFKEENAPKNIAGNKSEYIFYKRDFSEGDNEAFRFESSLLDGYFLASKEENGLRKLALKKSHDQVDESLRMKVR